MFIFSLLDFFFFFCYNTISCDYQRHLVKVNVVTFTLIQSLISFVLALFAIKKVNESPFLSRVVQVSPFSPKS